MLQKYKYHFILHLIVLIWGTTGILGDYIKIPELGISIFHSGAIEAWKIVFFRTLIAAVSLLVIGVVLSKKKLRDRKRILSLLGIGVIVGLHWFTFFYSIKISNVSIAVVCFSVTSLFTALLEPIIFKRKVSLEEIVISLIVVGGIVLICGFEFKYVWGIVVGLLSALFSTLFTVFNGLLVRQEVPSFQITKWEMIGACTTGFIALLSFGEVDNQLFAIRATNWLYLSILALVCTTLAFMVSVWVMKHVTPFTVSISVNMEPIYTILLALALASASGSTKETMSTAFYIGSAVILTAVFVNAWLKRNRNRKMKKAEMKKTV